jgi:glycine oxidase
MAQLTGLRLAVAGAGVFGLSVALRAAALGAAVELWEPGPPTANASGVAAGMIAPIGEALFEEVGAAHVDLLRAGRDGWRQIERLAPDLNVDRSGAVFLFKTEDERDVAASTMAALDVNCTPLDERAIWECGILAPNLSYGVQILEDWRVDPPSALIALRAAFIDVGGVFRARALSLSDFGSFDAVVLASGMEARSFATLTPELSRLSPIKGQLVRFEGAGADGPMIRTRELYLVPQSGCVLAGATMEGGRSDRGVDPETIAALRRQALDLMPTLKPLPFEGAAGVRAATPDGLPLAGPSSRPGLFLATGARRNGWLLAPLVGEILVSYLSGGDGGPYAAALDPRRFTRA